MNCFTYPLYICTEDSPAVHQQRLNPAADQLRPEKKKQLAKRLFFD